MSRTTKDKCSSFRLIALFVPDSFADTVAISTTWNKEKSNGFTAKSYIPLGGLLTTDLTAKQKWFKIKQHKTEKEAVEFHLKTIHVK